MIGYLFEFSTLFALFGLGYILLVKSTSNYTILRNYIFGSIIFSLGFPMVPELLSTDILVYSVLLPETTIIAHSVAEAGPTLIQEKTFNVQELLFGLFLLVTLVFALRFVYALFQVSKIIFTAQLDNKDEVTLLRSSQVATPFSFFNYVVIPADISLEEKAIDTIIKHEKLHIQFNHSLEKLFIEFFKVCVWWHPVSWLYAREIELVHEYQVDAAMTQTMENDDYKKILLQLIIDPQGPRMINPISSNIKKRLLKMNQKKIKNSPMRFLALFAIMAFGSLFIHSCQQEEGDAQVVQKVNTIDAQVPTQQDPYEYMRVDTFTTFDYDTFEETITIAETKALAYINPDKMPHFKGCDENLPTDEFKSCTQEKLLRFIYSNIVYPKEARDAGIEGMVVVRFLVSSDGYVFNEEFIKSPDESLEKSVTRMLRKMNEEIQWVPGEHNGKKVEVQYTLPVKFKLEG